MDFKCLPPLLPKSHYIDHNGNFYVLNRKDKMKEEGPRNMQVRAKGQKFRKPTESTHRSTSSKASLIYLTSDLFVPCVFISQRISKLGKELRILLKVA